VWACWQMHRKENNDGCILAFRRGHSPYGESQFVLHGLEVGKTYFFTDADSGETWGVMADKLLQDGLTVRIPNKAESRLIFYRAE